MCTAFAAHMTAALMDQRPAPNPVAVLWAGKAAFRAARRYIQQRLRRGLAHDPGTVKPAMPDSGVLARLPSWNRRERFPERWAGA